MRLGIIADIHGNEVALRAVLADAERFDGTAGWLLLEDDGHGPVVTQRSVPFDVDAVADDLGRRRHPNAEFVVSILTRRRPQSTHETSR